MTDSLTPIKVNALQTTQSFSNSTQLLALTDNINNTVGLMGKSTLANSLISSTGGNTLINDSNGLYVANTTGNLQNLQTTAKDSAVSAINENVNTINGLVTPQIVTLPSSGTLTPAVNTFNKVTPSSTITIQLPTITDNSKFYQILIMLNLQDASYLNVSHIGTSNYFNKKTPDLSKTGYYNIYYEYDNNMEQWVCGALIKGVAS